MSSNEQHEPRRRPRFITSTPINENLVDEVNNTLAYSRIDYDDFVDCDSDFSIPDDRNADWESMLDSIIIRVATILHLNTDRPYLALAALILILIIIIITIDYLIPL